MHTHTHTYTHIRTHSCTHTRMHTCTYAHTVEFPAVVLDLSSGEVVSEFHQYVQPQEHPRLSKFCTELTGITQVSHMYTQEHISG